MPKHIHAELIKLWADGAKIQFRFSSCPESWEDVIYPCWSDEDIYRLKPRPKTIKYKRYLAHEATFFYTIKIVYEGMYFNAPQCHLNAPQCHLFVKWIDTEWQEVELPE